MSDLRSIRKLAGKLKGKRVLVRSDLNIPLPHLQMGISADAPEISRKTEHYRVARASETLSFLATEGAKVIIVSHIGSDGTASLSPITPFLNMHIPTVFVTEPFSAEGQQTLTSLPNGSAILFENIRRMPGEMENDPAFAEKLAACADIYVNDAFSVSHRTQASVVGLPKFLPSYSGILFNEELKILTEARDNPGLPFLFILGGAKFDTKLPLIESYLSRADHVFVGGALAHNFFREQGYEIGTSLVSEGSFGLGKLLANEKLLLPIDVVVESERGMVIKKANEVLSDEKIVDAGPETLALLAERVAEAKMVLWNGPLGAYERDFAKGTLTLAETVAHATEYSSLRSIIGGGDTLAALPHHSEHRFTFVSTAGGALLDFLLYGTLVGIEALQSGKR